jgi:pheromone shutdown protein TraB
VLIPVFVVYLFLFGTRETLAEHIALDDLPSREEILSDDENFETFDSLVVDERDRILIEHVAKLDEQQNGKKQIGIVYGARHMRNLMNFLMQELDYRVVKAEWVKVFDL